MQTREATHPAEITALDTNALRARFVVDDLFRPGAVRFVYSHEDRIVLGGVVPLDNPLSLGTDDALYAEYFCQRRELAITNLGGTGTVTADGVQFALAAQDVLYIGQGTREVSFASDDAANPATYYLFSATAHTALPTTLVTKAQAAETAAGAAETANRRTIRKYLHQDGVATAQIVLGITSLEPGSVWNTMPCHTHGRRTEVYLYYGLGPEHRVVHLMGEPQRTRNLILADRDVVISPSWSVHTGAGTSNYAFVWAMAGENQEFDDMQQVATDALR
ncbi:5-dehydro-4-deoxy-D-glucuronate isomerase [Dactylosporangium salmoneum]|uniref:4-deoxy-L-threo-5-hexosulose-uronate ketol-isomerase n=1 Tax=Dactylosporangium salmoneum TaxID=53361 RepID=A0ABN3HXR6_9ACTN